MKKYTMTINEKQLEVVQNALEVIARVGTHQLTTAFSHLMLDEYTSEELRNIIEKYYNKQEKNLSFLKYISD